MRKWILILGAVVLVIFVASQASRGGVTSDDERNLARAMCDDLKSGASMFQMHSQAVEFYRKSRSEDAAQLAAAQMEDRATRSYCPEFRDEFEGTIAYQEWIAQ